MKECQNLLYVPYRKNRKPYQIANQVKKYPLLNLPICMKTC